MRSGTFMGVFMAVTTALFLGFITVDAAETWGETNRLVNEALKGEVWNKVNPPDVTREVIETAGPGGHILLKLKGVHSAENIDNVQVFFEVGAALNDGSVKWVRSHVASIVLESVPQKGVNLEFDVTNYFTFLLSHDPKELRNFTVQFVQVPKNNGVKQNDESFTIDWTYFEIVDAKGNPVPQPKREPKYG